MASTTALSLPTPSPILHSVYSYSSQLISSVHQDLSVEVFNVHPFRHLPVEAACVSACHLHCEVHIVPAVVMVKRMQLENRLVLIMCLDVRKVLSSTSVSIPARLSEVLVDIITTLFTNQ